MGRDSLNVIVDPPSGWRYGFPCVWDKVKHPSLTHLLVSHNYPQEDMEFALRYTRMWEVNSAEKEQRNGRV
jgi:hypothetical protein